MLPGEPRACNRWLTSSTSDASGMCDTKACSLLQDVEGDVACIRRLDEFKMMAAARGQGPTMRPLCAIGFEL